MVLLMLPSGGVVGQVESYREPVTRGEKIAKLRLRGISPSEFMNHDLRVNFGPFAE